MKVLLVEDDEDKREQLLSFLKEKISDNVIETRSFQSGLKAVKGYVFDLIIMDMTIPTFDVTPTEGGGTTQPFGGRMLLFELQRRGIKTKVIVVSQFDLFGKGDEEISLTELDDQLRTTFSDTYLGAIPYSVKYTDWMDILYSSIKKAGLTTKL